jgi:adenylate cyclase
VNARMAALLERLGKAVSLPGDAAAERLRKATLLLFTCLTIPAGVVWSVVYLFLGHPLTSLIPLAYALMATISLAHCFATRRYVAFRFIQLALILLWPCLLQWSLGGFVASGAVMLWSVLAPLGAVMFYGPRRSWPWMLGFVLLTIVSGALEWSGAAPAYGFVVSLAPPLPTGVVIAFFVMNVSVGLTLMYLLLGSFVEARDRAEARLVVAHAQ